MAVNRTGAMFKSLTFDGEDSRDYGVYITGQAVFNAPEREVEMISIPGRNGQFALDKGRFENIEVTYPAGIFANTEADFAEAVSSFRNLLCSKRGYVRLQDEYHPDEYRMAIYKSGLELENVALKAGEFEITFDCKPQRYLTSGEEEQIIGDWEDIETYSGNIISFTADGSKTVKSLVMDINPIQDLSGGNPSLSNICPISGWNEIKAFLQGLNQWDEEWRNGYYNTSGVFVSNASYIATKNKVKIFPLTYYNFHSGSKCLGRVCFYDASENFISSSTYNAGVTDQLIYTPANAYFLNFDMTGSYGATYNNNISINYPSTDHNYHAHEGNIYNVTLPDTVYGGSIDVVSGTLNVKPYYSSYNGETLVGEWVSDRDIYVEGTTPTIGAQVVNIGAVGTNTQITSQAISLLTGINNIFADSGDAEIEIGVQSSSLTNPTLFDAQPLLQLSGYGSISINGQTLSVNSGPMGDITVASAQMANLNSLSVEIGTQYANNGDRIKVTCALWQELVPDIVITNASFATSGSNDWTYDPYLGWSGTPLELVTKLNNYEFSYGTSKTVSGTITATCTMSDSSTKTAATTFNCIYNGSDTFTFSMTSITMPTGWTTNAPLIDMSPIILNSSQSRLGNPLYIDLEIGEAYKIENDVPVSINTGVTLPAKLPTLPSGTSTITFDNTYSQVKIVPRWWKV